MLTEETTKLVVAGGGALIAALGLGAMGEIGRRCGACMWDWVKKSREKRETSADWTNAKKWVQLTGFTTTFAIGVIILDVTIEGVLGGVQGGLMKLLMYTILGVKALGVISLQQSVAMMVEMTGQNEKLEERRNKIDYDRSRPIVVLAICAIFGMEAFMTSRINRNLAAEMCLTDIPGRIHRYQVAVLEGKKPRDVTIKEVFNLLEPIGRKTILDGNEGCKAARMKFIEASGDWRRQGEISEDASVGSSEGQRITGSTDDN